MSRVVGIQLETCTGVQGSGGHGYMVRHSLRQLLVSRAVGHVTRETYGCLGRRRI